MNLDEIQQIFFQECEEGLATLEASFGQLRDGDDDPETINTIFRAVHSIKGGAGAFGHENLQAFAHGYETLLDKVRDGELALDGALLGLIVAAFDTLSDHVAAASGERETPADAAMLDRLAQAASGATPDDAAEPQAAAPAPAADDLDGLFDMLDAPAPAAEAPVAAADGDWLVRLRPGPTAFENGAEPLLALRELATLGGRMVALDMDRLPPLDTMDTDIACLGWTFTVPAAVAEDDIRAVFEFMDEAFALSLDRAGTTPVDDDLARIATDAAHEAEDLAAEMDALSALLALDAVAEPAPVAQVVPVSPPVTEAPAISAAPPATVIEPAKPAPPAEPAKPAGDQARTAVAPAAQTIRVDLDKLDRLVNLVGELVITQAMLAQRLSEHAMAGISELTDLDHLTRELQDSTMAIRAQPMKTVFSRVPRIIRELEIETGKRVRLDVEGEMTEVDKTVVERIGEPLTHLIRNAVDHGLETPAEREAAGKPGEGVVRLSAAHQSGRIVITVADDGRGIDRARVKAKAIERQIIGPDAQLSDEEIDNLIFAPGFSTAATVSNISGRGVGMDVVRKNVQALGGRIGIQSNFGRGSSFSLSLPLTLAVLDGMIVTVGHETYVIPLSHIVESLRPNAGEVNRVGPDAALLNVRGAYVPIHHVGSQLGISGAATDPASAVLIVVESDEGQAVLMVDNIQDQRQVVVKSLEANYEAIHGLAGATILGDGRVALILDVDALIGRWRREGRAAPVPQMTLAAAA